MTQVRLGISLEYPEDWDAVPPEWPTHLPAALDLLELPGAALPPDEKWRALQRRLGVQLGVRDLMPAWFIRQAMNAGEGIFLKFRERFRERLRLAAESGLAEVGADFDFAETGGTPEEREKLRRLLNSFYPILEETGLTLYATARFPSARPEAWRSYPAIWEALHFHRLRFALDLYMHEAVARKLDEELVRLIESRRWELGLLRFHYEPELGNRMTLKYLLESIRPYLHFSLPVIVTLAPVCTRPEALHAELPAACELLAQLRSQLGSAPEAGLLL